MDRLRADFRAFLRTLVRQPGLSSAVICILALGLAATVVVYSVVDALVLDPFPYPAKRLVAVGSEMPQAGRELGFFERLSRPEIEDIRLNSQTLESLLPFDLNSVRVRGKEFPLRLFALFTWADPFVTLGVEPLLGRGFATEELRHGIAVAVISHELWQGHFGGGDVLGQPLVANGTPYEIIGVTPPATSIYGADLWLPLRESAASLRRDSRHFNLLAKLVPATDLAGANRELQALADKLAADHGLEEYKNWRLAATTWKRLHAFSFEDEAILALGAAVFVLLLVSCNLANLLLVRATGRRRETAVRLALGAGRWRVFRQAMTETAFFALTAGLLGLLLAMWGLEAVVAWLPVSMLPASKPAILVPGVLVFALAAVLMAAMFCGLAPALHLSRTQVSHILAARPATSTSPGTHRVHRVLVIAQIALTLVLLAGAGSLLLAWTKLARQDLGFDVEQLLSMRLSLPRETYGGEAVPRFFSDLQDAAAALPGIQAASVATQIAPSTLFSAELRLEDEAPDGPHPRPFHTVVGDGYFQVMGLEILRGRILDDRDRLGGPCSLVINKVAAERYFPGRDPLGLYARVLGSRFDSGRCQIVGVVATVRNRGPSLPPGPEVFTSQRQAGGRYNQMFLVVRGSDDPRTAIPAIRSLIQRLDPEQPIYAVTTATEALAYQIAAQRVTAQLLLAFATAALLIAVFGIYAVVAFGIAQRRREMGLRLALGALGSDLTSMVVWESLATLVSGLAAGVSATLLLTWLLRHQLMAIGDPSPWMLIAPVVPLVLATLLATMLPAIRVGKSSPAETLRQP